MKPGQPAVSVKKTAAVAARAGAVFLAALVALLAPLPAGAGQVRVAETAKPHDADKPPSGLDAIDRIQDWLARANREYQTTIIPRLSTPTPESEAARKAAEEAKHLEEARKASVEAKQAEEARKAAEEAKRAEAARQAAEEAKEAEEARKAAEEAKRAEAARQAAEKAKQAEEARKAAEEAKRAEEVRQAAEEAKRAEEARKAAEEAKQAEAARKAAEEAKQAEAAREAAEEAKRAEAERQAAEEAKQAEAARQAAEEAKQAEAAREAAEEAKQTEEARKAAEEAKQAAAARQAAEETKRAEPTTPPPLPQPIPEPGSTQAQKLPGGVLGSETGPEPEPSSGPPPESDSDLKEPAAGRSAEISKDSREIGRKATHKRRVHHRRHCRFAGRHITPPGHYTVRRGDSLWRISRYYYRRGWFYHRLYRANRRTIHDPDLIYPCQRIFVPRRR
jgi:nucleoid-associated protein YgaU